MANMVDMATLFDGGDVVAVRVRTGEKNGDGKHIAKAIPAHPARWCDSFLAFVIEAGCRAVVAEKLNNVPGEGGKKADAATSLFKRADAGEMPEECTGRAPGVAGGMDAVDAAIYKDGLAWIGALLADKAAKAGFAGTGAGGRFIAADWAAVAKGGALESVFDGKGNADSSKVIAFAVKHNPALVEAAKARLEAVTGPKGFAI